MPNLFDSFADVRIAVEHALANKGGESRSFSILSNAFPISKTSEGTVRNALNHALPPPGFVIAADNAMYGAAALDDTQLPAGPYRFIQRVPVLDDKKSGPHPFWLDTSASGVLSVSSLPVVTPDLSFTVPEVGGSVAEVASMNTGTPLKGAGVIVGIIDYGFDFAHPNFLDANGRTRLIALWNQNPNSGTPNWFDGVLDDLKPTGGWLNTTDNYTTSAIFSPGSTFQSSAGHASGADQSMSLNFWLTQSDPYQAYDPHKKYFTADSDPGPDDPSRTAEAYGAHGTHVADIAAGNGAATGRPGIAPEADIIFVQLPPPDSPSGPADASHVLDAVHFIACYAQKNGKRAVINLSVNANSGPHDAGNMTVATLDAYAAGTAGATGVNQPVPIVISAGNQFVLAREPMKLVRDPEMPNTSWNKKFRETLAQRFDLPGNNAVYWLFRRYKPKKPGVPLEPITEPATLEIWYRTSSTGGDPITVEVSSRANNGATKLVTLVPQSPPATALTDAKNIRASGNNVGKIHSRGALPGANMQRKITIEITRRDLFNWVDDKDAVGTLTVKLTTSSPSIQRAHAFIERAGINDPAQSSLILSTVRDDDDLPDDDLATRIGRASTLGTLSCGVSTIAVSAYFAPDRSGANAQIAEFSSSGPPVNYTNLDVANIDPETGAIEQPWISAPGAIVLAARSKGGRGSPPNDISVVMSGTSMAAPHVTGSVALLLEKKSNATNAEIRDALKAGARRAYVGASLLGQGWHKRFGHGRLSVKAAVEEIT